MRVLRVKVRLRVTTGRVCGNVLKSAKPERVLKSAWESVCERVWECFA